MKHKAHHDSARSRLNWRLPNRLFLFLQTEFAILTCVILCKTVFTLKNCI